MDTPSLRHYRKIVGGGALCLVLPYPFTGDWIWRYRIGTAIFKRGGPDQVDLAADTFETPEQFAAALRLTLEPT